MRSSISEKELRADRITYVALLNAYIAGWKARERRARAMQDYDDTPLPKD